MTALLSILASLFVTWDASRDPSVNGHRIHWRDADAGAYVVSDVGMGTPLFRPIRLIAVPCFYNRWNAGMYCAERQAWIPTPPEGTVRRLYVVAYAGTIDSLPSEEISCPQILPFEFRKLWPADVVNWQLQQSDDLALWRPCAYPMSITPEMLPPPQVGPANRIRIRFSAPAFEEKQFFRLRATP